MSQVSLLSVDVSQSPDTQGGSGSLSNKNQAKSSAFSDAMEQHYSSREAKGADGKDKQDGNLVSKTATEQSPEYSDSNADVIKKLKAAKEDDAHTLPVPIEVPDDDALKEKKSNDDAHTLPVPIFIEDDSIAPKIAPGDDAHTLPVPLPISLDDAALKEKLLAEDDAHTLPVPVAPLSPESSQENRGFQQGEIARSNDASVQNSQQSSSSNINTSSESGKLTGNDDTVNLLKMLNAAQKLLTGASTTDENAVQDSNENGIKADMKNEQLASAKAVTVDEQVKNNLTAEQKSLASSTGIQSELLTEKNAVSDAKNTIATQSGAGANAVEQKLIDAQQITTVKSAMQESALAVDNDKKAMAAQNNAELENRAVDESHKLDIAMTKETASGDTKTDNNSANKVANNIFSDDVDNTQKQDAKQSIVVESQRASEQTKNRSINQSTASVVMASNTNVKVDADQKTSANETADTSISNDVDVDGEKLVKAQSEKQVPLAEKITSSFNQTLDAQAIKPTTSTGELAARQEQSFESSINSLTTNTVQAQKAATALNTETIAIYRKDFANAVKDKVMVMINQKIQQVDIQLDPPEMGNIHVRVNLQNEQAAVQFIVQNQQAKEALEQNMGKLRDMLAESGVDVGDANIEQREAKDQNNSDFGNQAGGGQQGNSAEEMPSDNNGSALNMFKASSTGVDYYA
ncbi:flagellar hook-length control protein FliK [Colwellia sp. Arc7-635]|uniref:flagellar hook-length control protein FliK n=1 Tax=Colwellia sp. Arc7-635 TaxID=2497879 RepID=UPI000F84FBA7|nr:flagellar hook-length control protein FliK [Colwellia sp. Arc7-635]AZQ85502.1 flagellar hook-length control protein FliK [Colwellia sp. Arc7-635]